MTRYVAFLRGMNLGNRRITNEDLRTHFEELGFGEVGTFLASGNVVFEARSTDEGEIARRVREGLGAALGYEVPTFLRTADEVRAIAAFEPFEADVIESAPGKLQVAFLEKAPSAAERRDALAVEAGDDLLAFGDRELYWLANGGLARPDLDWKTLERIVGPATVRTRRTVERLVAKYL